MRKIESISTREMIREGVASLRLKRCEATPSLAFLWFLRIFLDFRLGQCRRDASHWKISPSCISNLLKIITTLGTLVKLNIQKNCGVESKSFRMIHWTHQSSHWDDIVVILTIRVLYETIKVVKIQISTDKKSKRTNN